MSDAVLTSLIVSIPAIIASVTALIVALKSRQAVAGVAKTVIETAELVRARNERP